MTQTEFNALPALLTRHQFMAATGLTGRDVDQLRADGMAVYTPPAKRKVGRQGRGKWGRSYAKYFKHEAARLAGFKL